MNGRLRPACHTRRDGRWGVSSGYTPPAAAYPASPPLAPKEHCRGDFRNNRTTVANTTHHTRTAIGIPKCWTTIHLTMVGPRGRIAVPDHDAPLHPADQGAEHRPPRRVAPRRYLARRETISVPTTTTPVRRASGTCCTGAYFTASPAGEGPGRTTPAFVPAQRDSSSPAPGSSAPITGSREKRHPHCRLGVRVALRGNTIGICGHPRLPGPGSRPESSGRLARCGIQWRPLPDPRRRTVPAG